MSQNFILALSVAFRNIHYINYFNLAYKRIAVFFFLLAVLVGIITVIIKVRKPATAFFLLRYNALSIYLILLLMCFINWDVFIVKYNFNNSNKAFVHLSYLKNLDDRALPYLNKDIEELRKIKQRQYKEFDFARNEAYITPEYYKSYIDDRIEEFKDKKEDQHWLSWNPAEQKAYNMLKDYD